MRGIVLVGGIGAWLMTTAVAALAASPAKTLTLTATVTAIFQAQSSPPSRRNWGVTVQVERVLTGKYTESTFTFRVHSPTRAGLEVGARYTIEASWNGHEYEVDETRPIHRNRKR